MRDLYHQPHVAMTLHGAYTGLSRPKPPILLRPSTFRLKLPWALNPGPHNIRRKAHGPWDVKQVIA